MTRPILYHYEMSPFSEKARLMLGYAQLDWMSVIVSPMPPRPELSRLIGGYRKIPVLQVGADFYCGTHVIGDYLAERTGLSALAGHVIDADLQAEIHRIDLKGFFALLMTSFNATVARKSLRAMGPLGVLRFLKDRAQMGRTAKTGLSLKAAKQILPQHLDRLNQRLSDQQAWLHGNEPGHIDFSAYHSLWFAVVVAERSLLADYPRLQDWFRRMQALGHGRPEAITATAARGAVSGHAPLPYLEADAAQYGQRCRFRPADYGRDATEGVCVGSDARRWVVARTSDTGQRVHLYLPKSGFDWELLT